MLFRQLCLVVVCLLALGGCATRPVDSLPLDTLWQDATFQYQPTLVIETRETLFALDDAVKQSLRTDRSAGDDMERRLDVLLARLYGPDGIRLSYSSGHSTSAAQTWHNKRGDCLSLTILVYAAAQYLHIPAHMQEVQVPLAVDRHDGVDFINGHVNVFVRNDGDVSINRQSFGSGGLIIDFEPQAGSRRSGVWLTEEAILARFYNNKASEYLVQKDDVRAYAYYRAALAKQADYAPAYTNLAQLYARHHLLVPAERLLQYAIAIGGQSYAPLRTMQALLRSQGRETEAQVFADQLAKRQNEDPYYWMGLGIAALQSGRNLQAIQSLERAAALTTGFEELHFHLGVAYWRDGQMDAARKQLAAMNAINDRDPDVAVLSKKLQHVAPRGVVTQH